MKVIRLLLSLCVLLSVCGCQPSNENSNISSDVSQVGESTFDTGQTTSTSTDTINTIDNTSLTMNDAGSTMNNTSSTSNKTSAKQSTTTKSNTTTKPSTSTTRKNMVINKNIICISPKIGATVSLLNEDMDSYASQKYTPAKMDDYNKLKDNFAPVPVQLAWELTDNTPKNYEIEVSLNSNMTQSVTYSSNKPELTLYNLFAAKTYYWRVRIESEKEIICSNVFSFSTQDYAPRTIYAQGVSNTRDIGGWKTTSGKRVKQGMIYRGASLDDITSGGKKTMVDTLGIKMDLDLRNSSETGGKYASPLGYGVQYLNVSFPYYAAKNSSTSIALEANHSVIVDVMSVLANPDNYPIYIHCQIGRDRTGTLISLINGLLGVSEEDLARDYELSYFAGCFGNEPLRMSVMLPKFLTITEYINTFNGSTYSESVEKYLLSIGVPKADINAIRSIMLE